MHCFRRVRDRVEQSLDALAMQLADVAQPPSAPVAHQLEGAAVLERAIDLIAASKRELYVSGWGDELIELGPALRIAHDRGVDISILRLGEAKPMPGRSFEHRFADPVLVLERSGCKLLVVVQDRLNVLIVGAVGSSMWALYSDDPAVVILASEYIRTDIAFQSLVGHVGIDKVTALFKADYHLQNLERGRGAPGLDRRIARSSSRGPEDHDESGTVAPIIAVAEATARSRGDRASESTDSSSARRRSPRSTQRSS